MLAAASVTFSPQWDTSSEWRDLLIFFFSLKFCQAVLPVASVGLRHRRVAGQSWSSGVACAQGCLVSSGAGRGGQGFVGSLMAGFSLVRCFREPGWIRGAVSSAEGRRAAVGSHHRTATSWLVSRESASEPSRASRAVLLQLMSSVVRFKRKAGPFVGL